MALPFSVKHLSVKHVLRNLLALLLGLAGFGGCNQFANI